MLPRDRGGRADQGEDGMPAVKRDGSQAALQRKSACPGMRVIDDEVCGKCAEAARMTPATCPNTTITGLQWAASLRVRPSRKDLSAGIRGAFLGEPMRRDSPAANGTGGQGLEWAFTSKGSADVRPQRSDFNFFEDFQGPSLGKRRTATHFSDHRARPLPISSRRYGADFEATMGDEDGGSKALRGMPSFSSSLTTEITLRLLPIMAI